MLLTTTTLAANWSNTSLAASYGRDFSEPFKMMHKVMRLILKSTYLVWFT